MEDVIRTHEGGITTAFRAYDGDTPLDTRLLVPAPFEEMYLHYMLAQLHYHNGEYDRYNRAMEQFRAVWDAFVNFYNRTHTPLGQRYRYF